jgi:hypothetical protein
MLFMLLKPVSKRVFINSKRLPPLPEKRSGEIRSIGVERPRTNQMGFLLDPLESTIDLDTTHRGHLRGIK